jgi:hypothetical protein
MEFSSLIGWCRLDEIYFVFSPSRKRKKETPPTLHTLPKPHEPTLKPKLCQRVQSCPRTHAKIELCIIENQLNHYIFDKIVQIKWSKK